MRKGASINIESGNVWYPAFIAEVWDTDAGTYLTIYYATTEWYTAYVEYAEYRHSTNTIVYSTEDGGESEHRWLELDEEVSFSPRELDALLQQEMVDYDDDTKEQAWKAWTAMTHYQKQTMVAGMHHLLEECASRSHAHTVPLDA